MDGNKPDTQQETDIAPSGVINGVTGFSEQDLNAYRLRLAGASYRQIAKTLGMSGPGQAYKVVRRLFAELVQEPADEVRQLEVERLDALHMKLWTAIENSETPFEDLIKAVNALTKIGKRRSELIGLDAPRKLDITQRIRDMAIEEGLDPNQAVRDAQAIIEGGG